VTNSVEIADGSSFPRLAERVFGSIRLRFARPEGPRRLLSRELGDFRLSLVEAGAHVSDTFDVRRRSYDPDSLKVVVPISGSIHLERPGSTTRVAAGQACLYDPTEPYRLAASQESVLLLLQMPRGLASLAALEARRSFRCLSGASGSLLADRLHQLLHADETSEEIALGEEIATLFGAEGGARSLAILRRRIEQFVRANLGCPDLTIAMIANSMGCTPRYIHRAFEFEANTPGDYIWEARLERARNRLISSRQSGSISEVAFSVGFSSSSHFSRAFRARYEITPSELRRSVHQPID
jgi:AraC-like DNA-binding protein